MRSLMRASALLHKGMQDDVHLSDDEREALDKHLQKRISKKTKAKKATAENRWR